MSHVESIPLPAASRLHDSYETVDLADAYAVRLPGNATSDPEALARFIFSGSPPWVSKLMAVRDTTVAVLGLKTSRQLRTLPETLSGKRVGIFRIYEKSADEIVMGEDDKHLDFRVSVRYEPADVAAGTAPRAVISTVVCCHNWLGRSYIRLIAPIHRAVVKSFLRRAARSGWPLRAAV